jgi:cation transport ATPase
MLTEYRIVHEVPGRIRLHIPAIGKPGYEASWLAAWMDAAAAVTEARANAAARTLVLRYTGGAAAREALLHRLGTFTPEQLVGFSEDGLREDELAPMVTTLLTLALLPWLTPPMQLMLTLVNVGTTLAKGADTLVRKGLKMEVLDAVAVGLAAGSGRPYTANVTDLLLNLGEYLQRRTARQSDRLLRRLLRPDPAMAWVERDGELRQVAGDEVNVGETVIIGPGETVPVDGEVAGGEALVSESTITGSELPVRKVATARVIAGSVLVAGRLRITATRVGADSTTVRVASFVRESLGYSGDMQRFADELTDKRAYLSLGAGVAVYGATGDLARLQSVFLVDYAGALKLGTPVAFKSALFRAAEHGVLLKGGDAIERFAAADTLVLDMPGSLGHDDAVVSNAHQARDEQARFQQALAPALARLRALGFGHVVLIAGDGRVNADAMVSELGIDAVCADEAADAKASLVKGLRAEGRKVAFVGDGPAPEVADVKVAVLSRADSATAMAADILLLDDSLAALADAREIARKTMGLIRGNVAAAGAVDIGILSGAVVGWLSPVASALLHNAATLSVLVNALKGVSLDAEARHPVVDRLQHFKDAVRQ